MKLLSIDPGRLCTAWALWRPRPADNTPHELEACGLSILPDGRSTLAQVCHHHAATIGSRSDVRLVVVEQMAVSIGRDKEIRRLSAVANDLLELQAIGAFIAGRTPGEFRFAPIHTWKGSAAKQITRNRVEATLQPDELELVARGCKGAKPSLHHNLYDAVGIGLWAVSRYVVRPA